MPTKAQAKAAIDAVAIAVKNDIDTIPPAGVNIQDGKIDFNPTRWYLRYLSVDKAAADILAAAIEANLTLAGRTFTTRKEGSYVDDERNESITIVAPPAIYQIVF